MNIWTDTLTVHFFVFPFIVNRLLLGAFYFSDIRKENQAANMSVGGILHIYQV